MTSTRSDEFDTAIRVVMDAGFDIVVKGQYARLREWLDAGGTGWPYRGWELGMPLVERRHPLLSLLSAERCDNVKIMQLKGTLKCVRRPGHYNAHWDGDEERWD